MFQVFYLLKLLLISRIKCLSVGIDFVTCWILLTTRFVFFTDPSLAAEFEPVYINFCLSLLCNMALVWYFQTGTRGFMRFFTAQWPQKTVRAKRQKIKLEAFKPQISLHNSYFVYINHFVPRHILVWILQQLSFACKSVLKCWGVCNILS